VQKAGEELQRLRGHNSGDLEPDTVVQAARDEKSPLHAAFEWDDSKAAHQHRLQTAGLLIRSVLVMVTGSRGTQPRRTRVSVTAGDTQGGATTARVVSPEEMHRARVDRGWQELEDWHKQYGVLAEFAGIAAALSGFFAMRAAEKNKAAKAA
jgi:hypothetical protein